MDRLSAGMCQMNGKTWIRRVLRIGVAMGLLAFLFILGSNWWVVSSTKGRIFGGTQVPENKVALVLGTSHRLTSGQPNPFFENRMTAAAALYHARKVSHILVSGDNRSHYYNEPAEMRKALVKRGVPASAITLDYAGLRTLDSVVRSKEIFGQQRITIVTQPFHCYRTLFICRFYEIDAVAVLADEPSEPMAAKVYVREYLARAKAVLDLYILRTSPRHLGQPEPV